MEAKIERSTNTEPRVTDSISENEITKQQKIENKSEILPNHEIATKKAAADKEVTQEPEIQKSENLIVENNNEDTGIIANHLNVLSQSELKSGVVKNHIIVLEGEGEGTEKEIDNKYHQIENKKIKSNEGHKSENRHEHDNEKISEDNEDVGSDLEDEDTVVVDTMASSRACSAHRIPSAVHLVEEEEEEAKVEDKDESREEFVIRKSFENFTDYERPASDGVKRLSEKRYLQMLRELGLIGPGTRINTTDAEINYFHHASDRRRGLTLAEFTGSLYAVISQSKSCDPSQGESSDLATITDEVMYPLVPEHHYSRIFMGVK